MFDLTERDILEASVSEEKLDSIYNKLEMLLIPVINIYSSFHKNSFDYITDITFDEDYIVVDIVGFSFGEEFTQYEIPIDNLFIPIDKLNKIVNDNFNYI